MIRLDAISIIGLPQMNKMNIPEPYAIRVNCVLHSDPLPPYQELEVRVNGVFQTGVHEGDQHVFSWQLLQAADRVQIALRSRGVLTKQWQGFWNEQGTIVHAGILPIQVFFDGKAQPPTEEPLPLISSASANGSQPTEAPRGELSAGSGTALSVVALAASDVPQNLGATRRPQDQQCAMEGDALTDAQEEHEEQKEEEGQWEDASGSDEEADEDRWEDELACDEGDDDGDQWEDEEDEEDQGEMDEMMADEDERNRNTTQPLADSEAAETGRNAGESAISHAELSEHLQGEPHHHPADTHLSTAWQVATFYANPLASEQALQSLQELVALTPKTLIVDVRPNSSQKKKYQEHDSLSKHLLRTVFGAKYWDRGWAIRFVSQIVPPHGRSRVPTWRYVVNEPEGHPDGIPSLGQKLAEGYALVVMDSIASYTESRRRAVVEELQRRIANLNTEPLR